MSNGVQQKGKNQTPPEPLGINRDMEISGFMFDDELPNPNHLWLNGVHGSGRNLAATYDAIEIMDKTCPPIQETFAIIESITGLETILLGDEKSDIYKVTADSLENLEKINNIIKRTLEAIKAGMIANEIIWETTSNANYWLLKDVADYHQSRFRFDINGELEIWDDFQWIKVDETLQFKVGSYATKYGNRYGFGLANYYYWPWSFYRAIGKRWIVFQEGLGSPRIIVMPGGEGGSIGKETAEKLKSWIQNIKNGNSFYSDDFLKVMVLESSKDSKNEHINSINYWSKQIAMLMVGTASHLQDRSTGTFAEEKVHEQIRRDLLLSYIEWIEDYMNNQIIKTLVNVNFGQQKRKNYPKWKIIVPQVADELTLKRIELAWNMELPLSMKHIYEILGVPQPEDGEQNILSVPKKGVAFSANPAKYKDLLVMDLDGLKG